MARNQIGNDVAPGEGSLAPGVYEDMRKQVALARWAQHAAAAGRAAAAAGANPQPAQPLPPSQESRTMDLPLTVPAKQLYRSVPENGYFSATSELQRLERDFSKFDLQRMLMRLSNGQPLDGYERDVCDAFGDTGMGQKPSDGFGRFFTIPWGVLAGGARDLQVAQNPGGANLVGKNVGPAVTALKPYMVAARAGMGIWSGLVQDAAVPVLGNASDFGWLANEMAFLPDPAAGTTVSGMQPHAGGGVVRFSGKLLRMQPALVNSYLIAHLRATAGAFMDKAVIQGSGSVGQPLGLLNRPGIGVLNVTAGTELASGINPAMSQVCASAGSDLGASFVMGTAMREALLPKDAADRGALRDDRLQGRPVHCTPAMPAASAVYGDWGDGVLGLWGGGIEIDVDPYAGFKTDQISVRCMVFMDCAFPNMNFTRINRT